MWMANANNLCLSFTPSKTLPKFENSELTHPRVISSENEKHEAKQVVERTWENFIVITQIIPEFKRLLLFGSLHLG